MERNHSQRRRSTNASSYQGFFNETQSDSFSQSEEQGAVGGFHTVRHEHHHHHHHHHHIHQEDQRPSDRVRPASFIPTDAPPSYAEAVSTYPSAPSISDGSVRSRNPGSSATYDQGLGDLVSGLENLSTSTPATRDATLLFPPRRSEPAWDNVDCFADRNEASLLADIGSEADWDINPAIFELPTRSRSSPVRTISASNISLASASVSPPISQLSLGSASTASTDSFDADPRSSAEGLTIKYCREEIQRTLLEVILYLKRHQTWCSADDAWDYLAERLCGSGRSALKEAEILWEFAFQAPPLGHFGTILCQDINAIQAKLDALRY